MDKNILQENIEKFKLMILFDISALLLEEPQIDTSMLQSWSKKIISFRVKQEIWGQKVGDEIRIKYPADWWQAFKERWFVGWMLKRWPVRYSITMLQLAELYPKWRPDTESVIIPIKYHSPGKAKIEGIEFVDK